MKKILPPILWILAFQGISGVIGYTTASNMDWYRALEKSVLTPPDIAFPIVWTSLYVMLALAGWFTWCQRYEKPLVFRLFWVQMLLNWAWSFVFFAGHWVLGGFIWILLLNLAMLAFIVVAWESSRKSALLVLPILVWGSFAAYLNFMIWILN